MTIIPPPKQPLDAGSPSAWRGVEAELRLSLPDDYKQVVTHYGSGQWQEFWFLLNPFTANRFLNLCRQSLPGPEGPSTTLGAERYTREHLGNYPHPIFPEPGGILPWASTDNGGRFFWLTEGSPTRWKTIYYPSRDPDFETYELSCSELLYGAVTGELPVFAEEFGSDYEYGKADAFVPYRLWEDGGEPVT